MGRVLQRKIATARRILKRDGAVALLRATFNDLNPLHREYRPNESRMAFEVLDAGSYAGFMIDVGAHYGTSLRDFAAHDWQVWAFEPDSLNRARLVQDYGSYDNVIIDRRALSDQRTSGATLYRSAESTGISGLSAFHPTHHDGERVDVTTLGEVFDSRGLPSRGIDFLKIDTEGYDLPVLRGLPWSRCKPRLILCEFENSKTRPLGYSFDDLAVYLRQQGYRVLVSEWSVITHYGGPHDWSGFAEYPCALHDPEAYGNLLATRDAADFETLLGICRREQG